MKKVLMILFLFLFFVACTKAPERNTTASGPENSTACTAEQRAAEVCYDLYQPVCGWFGQDIKCIKYPCAQTFSNSCFACQNKNVAYWTDGACPE